MYEWLRSFSSFAEMMINTIMPADGTDSVYFHAIALTVVLLAARIASKKDGFPHKFLAGALKGTVAKRQQAVLSALKTCPKCAEQLPLSALVCDTCDYNFLSMMVGHRHKLLPAPDAGTSSI